MQFLPFLQDLLCRMGKQHGKPVLNKMILLVHFLKLFLDLSVIDQSLLLVGNIIHLVMGFL